MRRMISALCALAVVAVVVPAMCGSTGAVPGGGAGEGADWDL